ncbi:MAG: hypothetical protein ABI353_11225 [Isosphaeraceae bacterium]
MNPWESFFLQESSLAGWFGRLPVRGAGPGFQSSCRPARGPSPDQVYYVSWGTVRGIVLDEDERTIALRTLQQYGDGDCWAIDAAVVLPEQVDILIHSRRSQGGRCDTLELGSILQRVLTQTARRIGQVRGYWGPVWQEGHLERLVRDDEELRERWRLIRDQPVRRLLAAAPEDYAWFYQRTIWR